MTVRPDHPLGDILSIVASCLVHAPALAMFLYSDVDEVPVRSTDITAEDYVTYPAAWREARGAFPKILRVVMRRTAKESAHVTTERLERLRLTTLTSDGRWCRLSTPSCRRWRSSFDALRLRVERLLARWCRSALLSASQGAGKGPPNRPFLLFGVNTAHSV